MAEVVLRPYNQEKDAQRAYPLYQDTLGQRWPLQNAQFAQATATGQSVGCLAISAAKTIGICCAGHQGETGQISVLMVDPQHQRQGVGTALLADTLEQMQQRGVKEVHVGSGVGSYIWPGIPKNIPGALGFFQRHGFEVYEDSVDMGLPLTSWRDAPTSIHAKLPSSVKVHSAKAEHTHELIAMVKDNFAQWLDGYQALLENQQFDRILLASQQGRIVGVTMVEPDTCMWKGLFPGPVGSLSALGVAESARSQGIGLALAARATDMLREQGMAWAYLGWTWLVDWYGQIGYKTWRTYAMAKRALKAH